MDDRSAKQGQQDVLVGVKGVRLKRFEQIVAKLLVEKGVTPSYTRLPVTTTTAFGRTLPKSCQDDNNVGVDWPFDWLPPAARVYGAAKGQLSDRKRATRKEDQLRSMLRCILALTTAFDDESFGSRSPYTVVDFGGGSGHLAIPLALLVPSFRVVVVDLSERSLALLHHKAGLCAVEDGIIALSQSCTSRVSHPSSGSLRACEGIPNLFTFHGPLQSFKETFDMAVALHLCGEATDVALRIAGHVQAKAIVFAPCCVGKLNREKKNPYIYQSTGSNTPTVRYPQSASFCPFFSEQDDWNALAKAADYSDMDESRTSRNAARRTAKALLETDRQRFLEETFGYQTTLTRMHPWEATPKNDILLAWMPPAASKLVASLLLHPDEECQADIQRTVDHLLQPSCEPNRTNKRESASEDDATNGTLFKDADRVDWTWEEEQEMRQELELFLNNSSQESVLVFPTRMGGRKRKLVHYVAEQMQLAHWCEGEKHADKTVAVARRGRLREFEVIQKLVAPKLAQNL